MSIIIEKIKNNLDLNKEEQKILQKEYSAARLKIFSNRFSIFFFLGIQLLVLFIIVSKFTKNSGSLFPPINPRISVVPLDKPITDEYADIFTKKINTLYLDKKVKSIVVSLRSPGGTPSASWRISEVLSDLQKDNKKPIYTYVESAAVSGSYMIASQSNKIYSNPFAIVGSIGVIVDHLVFEDLSKKIGFKEETLTTGEYKKIMSTFSPMSEKQKEYLQENLLGKSYEGFINVVAKGRNQPLETIRKFADGKIYVASDEKVLGVLVDKVINWSDFKKMVYTDNNILEDKVKFVIERVEPQQEGLFNLIGSTNFNINPNLQNNILDRIK